MRILDVMPVTPIIIGGVVVIACSVLALASLVCLIFYLVKRHKGKKGEGTKPDSKDDIESDD